MPKDNSNGLSQYSIAQGQLQWAQQQQQCQRQFSGLISTFAKDNSFGLREIGTIDNDMLLSTWGQAFESLLWFCSQCGGKNGSKFLPFS